MHTKSVFINLCIYYVARGSQEAKAFKRDHLKIIWHRRNIDTIKF